MLDQLALLHMFGFNKQYVPDAQRLPLPRPTGCTKPSELRFLDSRLLYRRMMSLSSQSVVCAWQNAATAGCSLQILLIKFDSACRQDINDRPQRALCRRVHAGF